MHTNFTLNFFKKYYRNFNNLPKQVQLFFFRSIFLFIIWKLSYHFYVKPSRILDRPLTTFTAKGTVKILNLFSENKFTYQSYIPDNKNELSWYYLFLDNKKVIGIADACNGLELLLLYVGFILCYPTSTNKRMLYFLFWGSITIFIINILRCCVMAEVNLHSNVFFDFAHHYLFRLIIYGVIFFFWVKYTNEKVIRA